MKKAVALILAVILMVGVFSACEEVEFQTGSGDGQYAGVNVSDGGNNEGNSDKNGNSESNSTNTNSNSKPGKNDKDSSEASGDDYLETDTSIPLEKHELPNYNLNLEYVRAFEQDGRYIKMVQYASLKDYNDYLSNLLKAGYTKYDQNQIGSNYFTTLINKTTFVSLSFTSGNKALKVVSEPLGDLYPRKQDNKYTDKKIQSLFTGVKNENKPIYSGMGFVIRLSDGSFIIIDGGGGDYNSVDSNKFLKILKEQSPKGTEKPVISAWIFTHCHDDHIGVFNAFSKDFHDKVIIKSFYYNFPPDEAILLKAKFMYDKDYYSYPTFKRCISDYYSDAAVIRPHSGEKYYIKNSVIEMLFSYEDLYPSSLEKGSVGDFNDTSLIFKINIGGQSMLITGDAYTKSANFVTKTSAVI